MDEDDIQATLEAELYAQRGLWWHFKRLVRLWLKIFVVIAVPMGIVYVFDNFYDDRDHIEIGERIGNACLVTFGLSGFGATGICFCVGVFRLVTWWFSGGGGQENITVINEATPTDTATEIEKYHDLFEKGIISQEEFNQKKSELL